MFESAVAAVVKSIRSTVRAIGAATRNAPWSVAAVILALFVVW